MGNRRGIDVSEEVVSVTTWRALWVMEAWRHGVVGEILVQARVLVRDWSSLCMIMDMAWDGTMLQQVFGSSFHYMTRVLAAKAPMA